METFSTFIKNRKSVMLSAIVGLLFIAFIPQSSFAQTDKEKVISLYEILGYNLLNSYDFTMTGEQQKYLDRTFYAGTDYEIILIGTEADADLFLNYDDGDDYDEDTDDDEIAIIAYSPLFTNSMQILAKNASSKFRNSNFTLMIFGK